MTRRVVVAALTGAVLGAFAAPALAAPDLPKVPNVRDCHEMNKLLGIDNVRDCSGFPPS